MTTVHDYFLALDIFVYVLAGVYAILTIIPIVQLVRTLIRIPKAGWTTQKLFLSLILISCAVRCAFFLIVPYQRADFFMVNFADQPAFIVLDTLPTILFYSAFTLLILFWVEIIYVAKNQHSLPSSRLRPFFFAINASVYLVLIGFWLIFFFLPSHAKITTIALNGFLSFIFILGAFGFIYYGGKLYRMLKQFPIMSRSRDTKLKEVGWITIICATACVVRAVLILCATFVTIVSDKKGYIASYYAAVEIVPSILVLFILRRIPRPRLNVIPTNALTTPLLNPEPMRSASATENGQSQVGKPSWDIN